MAAVAEEGSAARAGLSEGDRVLSAGGVPLADCGCHALRAALNATRVELVVERDGERRTVELLPRVVAP